MASEELKREVEKAIQQELPEDFFNEVEEYALRKLMLQERLFGPHEDGYIVLLSVDMVKQLASSYYTIAECLKKTNGGFDYELCGTV